MASPKLLSTLRLSGRSMTFSRRMTYLFRWTEPPTRKVGVYVRTFDASYRLPTTDFLDEVLCKNGVNVYDLTPNVVNKKYAYGFATPVVSIPSGKTPSPGNPPDAPLVVLLHPIPSEGLEHVEDNKEGIVVGATSRVTRQIGLLSLATLSDMAKEKTSADRCR
ncbi:unnamed protein product [Lactuca saligna]|uniref:Uncharacterized protein n=1 Tax=Lactuca saligna TaxID=75948 RepID=A0AA35YR77_LACSI|nr:unnamed protein product [Lactuca saligna]